MFTSSNMTERAEFAVSVIVGFVAGFVVGFMVFVMAVNTPLN